MPKFEITIRREVTTYDEFTRVIEADSMFEALQKGREIAEASDSSCPDDCSEVGAAPVIHDFYVEDVKDAPNDAEVNDVEMS